MTDNNSYVTRPPHAALKSMWGHPVVVFKLVRGNVVLTKQASQSQPNL